MILLTTDWGQAWTMAGISVGVVFSILVLLVIVLQLFSAVASGNGAAKPAVAAAPPISGGANSSAKGSANDEAAVATAVYLYLNGRHDEESGVLTINVNDHSLWHEELNDRL
ncbi:MAG: OadG family protein [Bacteroidaceae bacterium]|nr:OadG family protein [Bacteroidaceae bacterium]